MIGIEPSPAADSPDAPPDRDIPFHVVASHEGLWWPYRSIGRALFQVQRDRARTLAIHKQMIAEATAILRLERDMALQLSAKVLELTANCGHDRSSKSTGMFNDAIACVRELGEAVIDMQIRALTSMRDNSKTVSGSQVQPVVAATPQATLVEKLHPDGAVFGSALNVHALGNQSPKQRGGEHGSKEGGGPGLSA